MTLEDGHVIATLLLILLSIVILGICAMTLFVRHWLHRRGRLEGIPEGLFPSSETVDFTLTDPAWAGRPRPRAWLAVRSRNAEAVEKALGVKRAGICNWEDGLAAAEEGASFIAPPVNDWILVFGSVLPDPGEDVDSCFRFLSDLSAGIGQIQFFQRDPVLAQHAWVKVNYGKVIRAYAWAGETLWNQGRPTPVETQAGVHCLNYGDKVAGDFYNLPDSIMANVDKVALIASRWSLDPASIEEDIFESGRGILCHPS